MIIQKADRLNEVKEYYFVRKLEEIAALNKAGKNVINFGIGSPDLMPSEESIKALTDTACRTDSHGYQPYRSVPLLRQRIADFYQHTYGVELNADNEVLPLMGSKEGILHLSLAFLNPGDEVLVPNPGYPAYTSIANMVGAKIRYYNLTEASGWYPNFEEIEQADLSKVKIMWVNYAHMPTGTMATKCMLTQLIAFAKKHRILIAYDNPYSLVLNKEQALSVFSVEGAKDVAVELNSLSKSHNMAGWRVGMMLGKKEYLDSALSIKSNIDSGMFLGIQQAAIKALENSMQWHQQRNEIYAQRREWVFKILDLLKFSYNPDQVGLFVWAKPHESHDNIDIVSLVDKILQQCYVFFTPGEIFGSNGKPYMRASLCVPVEKIKEAYQRIEANIANIYS
jgi:hypothetical protein